MKKLVIAVFCLFLSIPAMAAGWTNWFTIDTLGYDNYLTDVDYSFFYIIPVGTVENPDSCSTPSKYVAGLTHHTFNVAQAANRREVSKLPTLAYTAGWQIRVYLSTCDLNLPNIKAIEIKKP